MVTDTLTGNLLIKVFSSFTTGGDYESTGYGYGPGVGEGYNRLVCIISRASGAPLICEALRYCATCAKNDIMQISREEFEKANKAGLKEMIAKMSQEGKKPEAAEEVTAPPKKVVTYSIAGIDILELDNAVKELWKSGIYSESGMGCTGPIILVPDEEGERAKEVLQRSGYIS
jgi:hypothetical protein